MSFKKCGALASIFFLTFLAIAKVGTNKSAAFATVEPATQNSPGAEFISVDELKTKLAKKEPVAIIDVRAVNSLSANSNKIKGAVYVQARKLKYRLGFPPLKDVPHDREVVTYCACPNDELSLQAAQVLRDAGFKQVRVLKGGWVLWQKANGPVEPM
jgi:rhodanese-related sulfurtransferase